MIGLLRFLLKSDPRSKTSTHTDPIGGFTMIELLVGTILAFLIITPLFGLVISLLNDDVREGAKATTESELQSALDFIAEDVSQAYYIYDPKADLSDAALTAQLPTVDDGTPVLAFWKRQLLPDSLAPLNDLKNPADCDEECDDTYVTALVVYYLVKDKSNIWCQPSGTTCPGRIVRYSIQDRLKPIFGGSYTDAQLKESQQGTDAFNPEFQISDERAKNLENVTDSTSFGNGQVLINYIDEFQGELDPNDSSNLTLSFSIKGNALRRNDASANTCTIPAYCPEVSQKVRGQNKDQNI